MNKLLLTGALLCIAASARATIIEYDVTNLGGTTWEYEYTITNDTLGIAIEEFTIYFDHGLFDNLLADTGGPAGWDSIEIQPDGGLPDDGFFDSLALGLGILPGETLGGFSVTFDYFGAGAPGAQLWEVVNPMNFATLESGMTVLAVAPVPMPEPGMLGLFAIAGFAALALCWRRRKPLLALPALCAGMLFAASTHASVNIDDMVLVERVRVDRTVFDYTYQIVVTNSAPVALDNVVVYLGQQATPPAADDAPQAVTLAHKGLATSNVGPGTELLDDVVTIGSIAAGATITSTDTFTLRQDRTFQLDPEALQTEAGFSATVTLSGFVTDQPISFAEVEVIVDRGESGRPIIESGRPIIESYGTTADAAGRYSVEVDFVAAPDFVTITANGVEQLDFVRLNSIVGSAGRLLEEATVIDAGGPDRNVISLQIDSADASSLDVTHVSTALAALATAANGGAGFTNDAALAAAQSQVGNDQLLIAAATLKAVIDNPEISLPPGVANTADLLNNPDTFDAFVVNLQENFPVQFQAAIDETIDAINVQYIPAEVPPTMYLALVRANPLLTGGQVFTFDQSGDATHIGNGGETTEATWTVNAGGQLVVDLDNSPEFEFFVQREVPPGSGDFVQVRALSSTTQRVIARLAVGVQTDQVLLGQTDVITFPDHVGVLPDEITVSEPDPDFGYLAFGAEGILPYTTPELSGRVFAMPYYHTDNDSVGLTNTYIGADLLTFNAGGTGSTARRLFSFTWAIDGDGILDISFPNGDVSTYVRYGQIEGGVVDRGIVIGRWDDATQAGVRDVNAVRPMPGLTFLPSTLEERKFRSSAATVDPDTILSFGLGRFDFNFYAGGSGCRDSGFLAFFDWLLNPQGYMELQRFFFDGEVDVLFRQRSWQAVAVVPGVLGPRHWLLENLDFDSTSPNFPTDPTLTPGRVNFYEDIQDLTENSPPVPMADAFTVSLGGGQVFLDVLGNDSDVDDDPLTVTTWSGSAQGVSPQAVFNDASELIGFFYTPPASPTGEVDTFTYRLADGACNIVGSDTTVTITLEGE